MTDPSSRPPLPTLEHAAELRKAAEDCRSLHLKTHDFVILFNSRDLKGGILPDGPFAYRLKELIESEPMENGAEARVAILDASDLRNPNDALNTIAYSFIAVVVFSEAALQGIAGENHQFRQNSFLLLLQMANLMQKSHGVTMVGFNLTVVHDDGDTITHRVKFAGWMTHFDNCPHYSSWFHDNISQSMEEIFAIQGVCIDPTDDPSGKIHALRSVLMYTQDSLNASSWLSVFLVVPWRTMGITFGMSAVSVLLPVLGPIILYISSRSEANRRKYRISSIGILVTAFLCFAVGLAMVGLYSQSTHSVLCGEYDLCRLQVMRGNYWSTWKTAADSDLCDYFYYDCTDSNISCALSMDFNNIANITRFVRPPNGTDADYPYVSPCQVDPTSLTGFLTAVRALAYNSTNATPPKPALCKNLTGPGCPKNTTTTTTTTTTGTLLLSETDDPIAHVTPPSRAIVAATPTETPSGIAEYQAADNSDSNAPAFLYVYNGDFQNGFVFDGNTSHDSYIGSYYILCDGTASDGAQFSVLNDVKVLLDYYESVRIAIYSPEPLSPGSVKLSLTDLFGDMYPASGPVDITPDNYTDDWIYIYTKTWQFDAYPQMEVWKLNLIVSAQNVYLDEMAFIPPGYEGSSSSNWEEDSSYGDWYSPDNNLPPSGGVPSNYNGPYPNYTIAVFPDTTWNKGYTQDCAVCICNQIQDPTSFCGDQSTLYIVLAVVFFITGASLVFISILKYGMSALQDRHHATTSPVSLDETEGANKKGKRPQSLSRYPPDEDTASAP